jgi:hypothetical protein
MTPPNRSLRQTAARPDPDRTTAVKDPSPRSVESFGQGVPGE